MDPARAPDPRHPEPERTVAPDALLTAAETAPELIAAWAEWLHDRARDRR